MNSKKNKQSWVESNSNSTHNPEVLVLPPDILEKLGINLGGTQQSKEISYKKELSKENIHETKTSNNKECIHMSHENESSSLETASLMNGSMLLSPTFNTVKADVDSNKIVSVSKQNNLVDTQKESKQPIANNIDGNCSNCPINIESRCASPKICIDSPNIGNKNKLPDAVGEVPVNISNDVPRGKSDLKKKIHIISQEILSIDRKNNLNLLKPSNLSSIISLKSDTVLPYEKKTNKNMEQNSSVHCSSSATIKITSDNCIPNNLISDSSAKDLKNNCENINLSDLKETNNKEANNSDREIVKEINQYNQYDLQISLIKEEVDSPYEVQTNHLNKGSLGCNTITHCKKLKTYSNSFQDTQNMAVITLIGSSAEGGKNLESNLNDIEEPKICKDKEINAKGHIVTSKLSIQGVEKPGGNIKFVKNSYMRTYSKREKSKVANTSILSMYSSGDNLEVENSDTTVKESSDLVIEQNVCVCEDFGRFTYNDTGTNYEHVHFWSRKPVCSLELFSSIYYDTEAIETNRPVETIKSDVNLLKLDDNFLNDLHDGAIVCCNNTENVYKNINLDILFPKRRIAQNEQLTQNCSIIDDNVEMVNECVDISNEDGVANKLINNDQINKDNSVRENMFPNKSLDFDTSVSNKSKERERLSTETQTPCKENVTLSEKSLRRKRSATVSESDKSSAKRSRSGDRIICGVCKAKVSYADWDDHVSSEHDFIAWKDGEKHFNIEDKKLFKKLEQRLSETGKIICTFCDKEIYDVTDFIEHVKICNYWRFTRNHQIMCGVCKTEVEKTVWIEHICKEHNYLAWEVGEPPLDLSDKNKIRSFLNITSKAIGGLECSNCGIKRKLVKCYIGHLKNCANIDIFSPNQEKKNVKRFRKESVEEINKKECESKTEPVIDMSSAATEAEEQNVEDVEDSALVTFKCGVCHSDTNDIRWIVHIQEHNYVAWKEGETPVNVNDEKEVHDHLYAMSKLYNGLVCSKCGLRRKYVKAYLNHMKVCDGTTDQDTTLNDTVVNESCASELNTTEPVLNESNVDNNNEEEIIECGVCHQQMQALHWVKHILKDHSYIAWKEGDTPINVDDECEVHEHLYAMSKRHDGLICAKCGLRRKYVKSFLNHIKVCDGSDRQDMLNDSCISDLNATGLNESAFDHNDDDDIECGVCHEKMLGKQWITHIQAEHSYLAWKEGQTPITDDKHVNDHLYALSKRLEGLTCAKCGVTRKYVKTFLTHIKTCDGSVQQDTTLNGTVDSNDDLENIECGVCHQQMLGKNWHQHIQKEHAYLAWKESETPVDLSTEQNVNSHLYDMNRKYDGLTCSKCGLVRKYVKAFVTHIQTCDSTAYLQFLATGEGLSGDTCKCGVCDEEVEVKRWKAHAMLKHYNLAWRVGDYPIDVKNPYVVEKYLKEYKNKYKKFVCSLCGLVRVSCLGFYAHILQCGKTQEELDSLKIHCDICDTNYLYLYKSQHLSMHREQELAKERKLSFEAKKLESLEDNPSGEGRMAAKKARNVIEKYKSYDYNCTTCGYGADEEKELEEHSCRKILHMDPSDSEMSIKEEDSTTDDEEIDSSLSDMEMMNDKKKKHGDSFSAASRIRRVPFAVQHPRTYLQRASLEYFATYLSHNEIFYPLWRECGYEIVNESQISLYLPPLEESCNLKLNKENWTTLKKFETKKIHGVYTTFVGSSIQRIAWSPSGAYLAVSVHGAADTPRVCSDELCAGTNSLQLWEYGTEEKFQPKYVLGIAHEYGLVWGMDWCPSGAADVCDVEDQKSFARLGLLAIACSNGYAYILSVPYPASVIKSDNKMCKLQPVAELRLSRGEQKHQATSISWSPQIGHTTILVGYSNGTTALYDLHSESPLLVDRDNDVIIYYPYHDEKTHNTCVTGVSTFPLKFSGGELVSSASPTGAETQRRVGAAARLRTHLATSAAQHTPHWPSLLLVENDSIVNQAINELDWWCAGRRLGAMNSCSTCLHCGVLAAYSTPAIKIMKPHPAYCELHKDTVAIIDMVPLDKKVSKQKNDDFAVKLEPLTYNEVIKSYGVELKFAKELDRKQVQNLCNKEQCPERYPLSDIPSMAFNPSSKRHKQLAMATHSGFIFLITV